jgi:hypothetical protein
LPGWQRVHPAFLVVAIPELRKLPFSLPFTPVEMQKMAQMPVLERRVAYKNSK